MIIKKYQLYLHRKINKAYQGYYVKLCNEIRGFQNFEKRITAIC